MTPKQREQGEQEGTTPGPEELIELEGLALELAVRAGAFVHDERPDTVRVASTKSTVLDVVTAMDTGSEQLIRDELAERRPQDGILGEEEGLTEGSSGLTWVVDPIDGTVNYLYDLPEYAVSVAVVTGDPRVPGGWRPLAGAVSNPRLGEVFHARAGGGAFVRPLLRGDGPGGTTRLGTVEDPAVTTRERRLRVNSVEELGQALVGTGFSYDAGDRQEQGAMVRRVLQEVRDIRRTGSAALDLCAVAAGRLDAHYERGLNPWDVAAGVLLVTEAGGAVSVTEGSAGRHMLVAAGPGVHGQLHDLVNGP